MKLNIALLAGDGIGPEVIDQAVKVSDAVAKKFGHEITWIPALTGAAAIDAVGEPYPDETHAICEKADAVLFGAIGHPKYDNDPTAKVRPEQGLLKMRKKLGLFANVRPTFTFPSLIDKLREVGLEIEEGDGQITAVRNGALKSVDIKTMPYPGFPTDLQGWHSQHPYLTRAIAEVKPCHGVKWAAILGLGFQQIISCKRGALGLYPLG
mgnify:CR=1 FL=1